MKDTELLVCVPQTDGGGCGPAGRCRGEGVEEEEKGFCIGVCLGGGEGVGGCGAGGGVDGSMVGMLVTDQVPSPWAQADASDQQPCGGGGGNSGLGSAAKRAYTGGHVLATAWGAREGWDLLRISGTKGRGD